MPSRERTNLLDEFTAQHYVKYTVSAETAKQSSPESYTGKHDTYNMHRIHEPARAGACG